MLTIIDNAERFAARVGDTTDKVLGEMAIDMERLAKMQVPHDKGTLQNTIVMRHVGRNHWLIPARTPYARRWEFETPSGGFKEGRKSGYLRDPGKLVADNFKVRMKAALAAINL